MPVLGFIVSAWDERLPGRRIFATGRLVDGRSFAVVMRAPSPAVFVAAEAARATGLTADAEPWTSFDGRTLARLPVPRARDTERQLAARGIHVHHIDDARASDVLLALGIRGPVEIRGGTVSAGRRVDVVVVDPELRPASEVPALRWLALEVEGGAVSLCVDGATEVIAVGDTPGVASERDLLARFCERVRAHDPDVITGWNVLERGLAVLAQRCVALGVPLDIGRVPGTAELVTRRSGRLAIEIAGRSVVDAKRTVRASGERVHAAPPDTAAEVLELLRTAGLDALTVRRAALTGVSLDLAWTSIPAFERVYAAALRARHVVAPPRTERVVDGAAGGTVLEAEAGLFADVLVFDFRSLYPSLMRTFHIDPLAYERALARPPRPDDVIAPNGARFERGDSILPAILTAYAREREAALAAGDETAAYVYKILQNSFYGVLGSSGCRYARSELAGAITSFGKHFLTLARDWFEARGHHVLYGDTDSVFVQAGRTGAHAELSALGAQLADDLNRHITDEIRASFSLASHLRIRCDKIYRRFLIQHLRNESDGRGRGKGYAGLRLDAGDATDVEVRGMEAVRSDFTPLARRFQLELMRLLFADADLAALRAYCTDIARALVRGELDRELVYTKVLRRAAEDYGSETPQVRAARMLGWSDRGGAVEYVMTRAGAEPLTARTAAPLDYEHYRDRQLVPIARAIANVLGTEIDGWFNEPGQLGLFPT